jgi:hypothetical protein
MGESVEEEYRDAQIGSGEVLLWLVVEVLRCTNNLTR